MADTLHVPGAFIKIDRPGGSGIQTETIMHISTFEYIKPTDEQVTQMTEARQRAFVYANAMDALLPEGPDKTYIMRRIRETAMWTNVAITRHPDGAPRT